MYQFLKKLYSQRFKRITVILLDDTKPGQDDSYSIRPNSLFILITVISLLFSVFVALTFMLTPLGALLYNKEDIEMRRQVVHVTERVVALQDSLDVRNTQLEDMKNIIRLSMDTTLQIDDRFAQILEEQSSSEMVSGAEIEPIAQDNQLSTSGIVFSNILRNAPSFPAPYPVEGILSRDYEPDEFHFGIDLATKSNIEVTAIADGTVVNASWTMNDGYVMIIQHAGGIVTVFKHCSSLTKKSGDVVLKGDII
ncbi:MAG TPA: hypothetical protein DEQ34_06295, partial [Balneolaceae bacterium]|nr:hypothetical protein [Balneolaceae bacterium]